MDTLTHGIAGALISKAFFSRRYGRTATFALTLGSVFPDCDVLAAVSARDPMALLKYHRGITHSFVAMPLFAVGLAWLTRWYARRRSIPCPFSGVLVGIYLLGIGSHILLDLMTSFGTRIWDPLSYQRYAWDWIFIVDFAFTGIVLLPQVLAWVYNDREGSRSRAWLMWALFGLLTTAITFGSRWIGTPISLATFVAAWVILAVLFFLPGWRGWGFRVSVAGWARAGAGFAIAYLAACGIAHHAALAQVERFAGEQGRVGEPVERLAAVPTPPGLLAWDGMILTPTGVYEGRFALGNESQLEFRFVADAVPNRYTAAALALSSVKTYLGFARFPVVQFYERSGQFIVELNDMRFFEPRRRGSRPFTYRVVLDQQGEAIQQGWVVE